MKFATAAFGALCLAGCASARPPITEISSVLAEPAKYHGQLVRIRGAAVFRFEATFICPEPELIDSESSKKCLWLAPGETGNGGFDLRPFHQKTVEIVGRFNSERAGHMGQYGGTIGVTSGKVIGTHNMGNVPPAPLEPPRSSGPSANNSFKGMPLRGTP